MPPRFSGLPFPCGQEWTIGSYDSDKMHPSLGAPNSTTSAPVDLNHAFDDYDAHATEDHADSPHDATETFEQNHGVVLASADGQVVLAGWNTGGYGNVVQLDHGNGWSTVYAHLEELPVVEVYAFVDQGDKLGEVGDTGGDYSVHLHYEQNYAGNAMHVEFDGVPVKYTLSLNDDDMSNLGPLSDPSSNCPNMCVEVAAEGEGDCSEPTPTTEDTTPTTEDTTPTTEDTTTTTEDTTTTTTEDDDDEDEPDEEEPAPAPSIVSVSPDSGPQGTTFTFTQTGLVPNETMGYRWVNLDNQNLWGRGSCAVCVDDSGSMEWQFKSDVGYAPGTWEFTFNGYDSYAGSVAEIELTENTDLVGTLYYEVEGNYSGFGLARGLVFTGAALNGWGPDPWLTSRHAPTPIALSSALGVVAVTRLLLVATGLAVAWS